MARVKRKPRSGPIVVKRNGKTFLRKRPKSHRIYVDRARKAYNKRETTRATRLQRQTALLEVGQGINKSYAKSRMRQHAANNDPDAAFRSAAAHTGLDLAAEWKQQDINKELRGLHKSGLQRQVRKHPDFKNANLKEGWTGYYAGRGGRKYVVKEKSVFNKRKWNK